MRTIITILLLALSQTIFSQKPDYELYKTGGSLRNGRIVLYKDSTWCLEHGGESSSYFSFGKWTQKQNTLTCTPVNSTTFNPISKIDTFATNDSLLTVSIFDKKGNNITWQVTVIQHLKNNHRINMPLDSANTKRTCIKETNSTIVLGSLQKMLKLKTQINTGNATLIKIYLNTPENWLFGPGSKWDFDSHTFKLIKDKNRLTSTDPYDFGWDTDRPTVFIKQKNN
ncbi:hypothetical protein A4D02_09870 [Niastella koreensis]|uniref:Uncharacterized protein n=2 Tax=Niastella koreensis TaxID=354356 RepID=G8TNE5_NIAKG|nr:hypothetical protein [Niastella koreensis]AEV98847.1 hypothetical protein Niako_2507 [Niastella koreensis GR20-10]OQP43780.1 hypothetical protein A4D02_09870 [Niastella koreensis]